jgi:hypothetical protein
MVSLQGLYPDCLGGMRDVELKVIVGEFAKSGVKVKVVPSAVIGRLSFVPYPHGQSLPSAALESSFRIMLSSTSGQGRKCQCQCSNTPHECTTETVASLDQEIQHAKDRLRDLVHRRNAILPIGRLPLEILYQVLVSHKRMMPLRDWPRRLMALSHVCSTWRTATRSFPSLWTFIDFDHKSHTSLAQESLSLSQSLPISVCSDVHTMSDSVQVFNLWPRLKRVDLKLFRETWFEDLLKLASTPAPHLRSISLDLLVDWDNNDNAKDVTIPGTDVAPNLVSVRLNLFTESLQRCTLRALDISNTKRAPLWTTFRDVLATQEQLELLYLVDSIPEMAGMDTPYITQAPARLTNLQFLKVEDNLEDMRMFLRVISLGPRTRISLNEDGAYSANDFIGLAEHTAAHVKLMSDHLWLEISVKCTRDIYHLIVRSEGSENEPAILSLRSDIPFQDIAVDALFKALTVLGGRVRTLRFDMLDFSSQLFPFPMLEHVHTVEAFGSAADRVLFFLTVELSQNSQDVCWPNLAHLKLCPYLRLEGGDTLEKTLRQREQLVRRRLASLYLNVLDNDLDLEDLTDEFHSGSYEDAHESERLAFMDVDFQAMVDQLVKCQLNTP